MQTAEIFAEHLICTASDAAALEGALEEALKEALEVVSCSGRLRIFADCLPLFADCSLAMTKWNEDLYV